MQYNESIKQRHSKGNHKMKKALSLVLSAALLIVGVFALASCGNKDSVGVKVIDIPLTNEEYAFAVQKGDTALLNQLNSFLAEIQANGKFTEIINKYFGDGTPSAVTSAAEMKTDGSQLIVATNAAFEPFEYMVGSNYYGVDMEIMKLFADSLGKEIYINNMDFDAVCLSVSAVGGTYEDENGIEHTVAGSTCNIAAAGLTVSEKRKETLDFSTSYYNASQMLIVAENDTTFDNCKTAADVEAILKALTAATKVGVQNGTTGELYCRGDESWGFDGYQFTTVGYASGTLATQDVLNGNVKYIIIDEGPAKAIVEKVNAAN